MTIFPFTPTNQGPFQFNPTLDGEVYNCVVTWSLFGRRYYLNVYSLTGALVAAVPLTGSPSGVDAQTVTWEFGEATVTTVDPHGHDVGGVVSLTVSGAAPDAYNGTRLCEIQTPDAFTFPLDGDPGAASVPGRVDYNINLVAGYFASTLVYREAARQFEVSP